MVDAQDHQDRQRLHRLLDRTLTSEHPPPFPQPSWNDLCSVVSELGEAFAKGQYQATLLDSGRDEVAALRQRFNAICDDFLTHARQRAICSGKSILGFSGGFGTGKSSLLNHLVGRSQEELLPTKVTPDTAVPAFLLHSPAADLWIESYQGTAYQTGSIEDLWLFRHSETETFEPWRHLIKSLYVLSPEVDQEKVAYLDLPGHTSGPDDHRISLEAVRQCDAVVYLISVNKGDVKDTDVEFLLALEDLHLPTLVVLTKCDLLPPSRRASVRDQVHATLDNHGIVFEGPVLWSIHEDSLRQPCLEQIRIFTQRSSENKDRWQAEVEKLAGRLEALTMAHHRRLKKRNAKPLDAIQDLVRSKISDKAFEQATKIAKSSRYLSDYIDESFFDKTFQSSRFSGDFYRKADQWRTTHLKGFSGPINTSTVRAVHLCLHDAIDDAGWYACLNKTSPTASSDKWYYRRLKDIQTTYDDIRDRVGVIRQHVTQAAGPVERSAGELAKQTKSLNRRLVKNSQQLILAAKKEDYRNAG